MWLYYGILLYLLVNQTGAEEQVCRSEGLMGSCTEFVQCESAVESLIAGQNITKCGYSKNSKVMVCCYDNAVPDQGVTPDARSTPNSNTDYPYDDEGCPPIANNQKEPKIGKKSWQKCLEYQDTLVFPCMRSLTMMPGKSRRSHCQHNAQALIIGGTDAATHEFPHMVLLGYNIASEPDNTNIKRIEWLCDGSLISERYVLTAGHCLSDNNTRNVKYVYVGANSRTDTLKKSGVYYVKRMIKYPTYNASSKYNDIALLELDRNVTLDEYTVPACLPFGDNINDSKVTATGWGSTEYRGRLSNNLLKVNLNKFSDVECYAHFPSGTPKMIYGFDDASQLCYGDKSKSRDTCQGDSGGPIQIDSDITCMYVIVGVTSFGRSCGFVGEPAIYTKVSSYLSWIENIVWP